MIPTKRNQSRQLYDCYIDGEATPIVSGTWDPDSDVCRVLVARSQTDETVEFWHEHATFAGLRVFDVRRWALTQTLDSPRGGLGRRKYCDRDLA